MIKTVVAAIAALSVTEQAGYIREPVPDSRKTFMKIMNPLIVTPLLRDTSTPFRITCGQYIPGKSEVPFPLYIIDEDSRFIGDLREVLAS
ncbi:hypothetical protein [Methanoregula boonei]|jgi:hypothetical protein|uniref:hypothetical protein n=1 Tax=Methanoregula boonei TaxID=358766 RepID=UPI0012F81E40|nr:hypothetical protein [Methanoregula boonei]